MKSLSLIAGLIVMMCMEVLAQTAIPVERFLLNTDFARFRYDDMNGYLEVYLSVPRRLVTLKQYDGRYYGSILITVEVTETISEKNVEHVESSIPVHINSLEELIEHGNVISQMGFRLPHGNYRLTITASDSIDSERTDIATHEIEIKPYPPIPSVSDIEICTNIIMSTNSDDPFYKNSLEVYPNSSLLFGALFHPVLFVYSELYNLNTEESYYIHTAITDFSGNILIETKKRKEFVFRHAVEVNTLPITSYPSGKYRYRFSIYSESDMLLSSREKSFFVYNPHMNFTEETKRPVFDNEIALLSSDEVIQEFRYCRYIASREDIWLFDQLIDDDARRSFLISFWEEIERGRIGLAPIRRSEYLERVVQSNKNYRAMGREGWHTDRGRVYIIYGKPDEIERYPSGGTTKPYEIWRYYQIENGVEFVFIDRSGYGEYTLAHSTKRGELKDDMWQQYLR